MFGNQVVHDTHKPKHDRWLARHKSVHFHFTPTHASWLNQLEIWFSILSIACRRLLGKPVRREHQAAPTNNPPGWLHKHIRMRPRVAVTIPSSPEMIAANIKHRINPRLAAWPATFQIAP